MINKKSMLAEFAKAKKPAIEVSIEREVPEQEESSSSEPMSMSCPHCGAKISLSASKAEEAPESESSENDSQPA